jgi:hypothetical protein
MKWGWGVANVVECLPDNKESLNSNPSAIKKQKKRKERKMKRTKHFKTKQLFWL